MAGITSKREQNATPKKPKPSDEPASPPAATPLTETLGSPRIDRLEIDVSNARGDVVYLNVGRLCERALWHHQQWLLLQLALHPELPQPRGMSVTFFESVPNELLREIERGANEQRRQRNIVTRQLILYLRRVPSSPRSKTSLDQVCDRLQWLRSYPDASDENESTEFADSLSDAINDSDSVESVREIWRRHAGWVVRLLEDFVFKKEVFELGRWIEEAFCPPDVASFMRRNSDRSRRWWQRPVAVRSVAVSNEKAASVIEEESPSHAKRKRSRHEPKSKPSQAQERPNAHDAQQIFDAVCCRAAGVAELKPMPTWIEDATPVASRAQFAIPILERFEKELSKEISSGTRDQWIDCVYRLAQDLESSLSDARPESNDVPRTIPLRHPVGLTFDLRTNELTRDNFEKPVSINGTEQIALITALMRGGKPRVPRTGKQDQRAKSQNNKIAQQVSRLNKKLKSLKVEVKLRGEQYLFVEI